jgi:hypothetical protein
MNADLSTLSQSIEQLKAEMALLKAQRVRGQVPVSPWLPLKEASIRLHFSSPRALRNRIKNGQFPPDCYQQIPSTSGKRHVYLINVESYLKKLN